MLDMQDPAFQSAAPIAVDIFCQNCGYNLRGLTCDRCTECGRSLEGIRSETTRIPWAHRREIGWFRAYWKTFWFVMFRQKEFCDEMARPVGFAASQGFRWTTVAFAYLPVLAADLVLWIERMPCPDTDEISTMLWSNMWFVVLLHLGFVLFLAAATGVPSYFFHPRDVPIVQQNRAIALSYYASGPLSLFLLPTVAAMTWLHVGLDHWIGLLSILLMVILPILQFGIWWSDLYRLARGLMPQRPQRAVSLAILCPLFWLILLGLCFVAIPALVLYVVAVFASFRL